MDKAVKPTKKFLEDQIEAIKVSIYENRGALNILTNMLKAGCYAEEKQEDTSVAQPK